VQGERADVTPSLLLSLPLSPGITFSAGGGYQFRGYLPDRLPAGDRSGGLGIASAEARLETALERTYRSGWASLPLLKHILLPKVAYQFVQTRNQEQLPFYDWDDRVLGRQEVTWSLANVVRVASAGNSVAQEWRDLLQVRVSQGLLLEGSRRDLLAPVDIGDRLGDLRLEMLASPLKELSIWLDSRYNPNRSVLSNMYFTAEYRDLRDNLASIGYYEARHQLAYLEGRLATSLLRPVYAEYRGRYSPDRPGFLESYYSLEYRHQCWGVTVSYRDRPDNREVMVSFSLGGIGSLGNLKVF
jgi:LPS-assembly protein